MRMMKNVKILQKETNDDIENILISGPESSNREEEEEYSSAASIASEISPRISPIKIFASDSFDEYLNDYHKTAKYSTFKISGKIKMKIGQEKLLPKISYY